MEAISNFDNSLSEIDVLVDYAKRNIKDVGKYQMFIKSSIVLLMTKFEVFIENFFDEHSERARKGHTSISYPQDLKAQLSNNAANLILNEKKYNKKKKIIEELIVLFSSTPESLKDIKIIKPDSKFNYGKHGQKEIERLFILNGLKPFIESQEIQLILDDINSCINIRNNIIHQDAAPSITHLDVMRYRNAIAMFKSKLEAEIETNKNIYYNE